MSIHIHFSSTRIHQTSPFYSYLYSEGLCSYFIHRFIHFTPKNSKKTCNLLIYGVIIWQQNLIRILNLTYIYIYIINEYKSVHISSDNASFAYLNKLNIIQMCN